MTAVSETGVSRNSELANPVLPQHDVRHLHSEVKRDLKQVMPPHPSQTKRVVLFDHTHDVLNSLPDAVELAVELVVACSQATRHAPLNVLGQHMWA